MSQMVAVVHCAEPVASAWSEGDCYEAHWLVQGHALLADASDSEKKNQSSGLQGRMKTKSKQWKQKIVSIVLNI